MHTLKALLITAAIVLTTLAVIASAYVLYLLLIGTFVVLLFNVVRGFSIRRAAWN